MAKAREIVNHVSAFLSRELSLDELDGWSASYLQYVYRVGDNQDQSAIQNVRAVLNAFDDDENEEGLRQELAAAIRPFEKPLFPFVIRFAEDEEGRIPPQMETRSSMRRWENLSGAAFVISNFSTTLPVQHHVAV
jgi:hypothetical protein